MTLQSLREGPIGRPAAIVAALAVQVVYFTVRARTLNFNSVEEAIFSLLVFAAELGLGVSFALVLFELWRPFRRVPPTQSKEAAVDVILVVADEDQALVRASLAACHRLDGPHRTLILDCQGRTEVRAVAEETGVEYFHPASTALTRGAALDAVLPRLAGELVAVFDAGAIPEANLLAQISARFGDVQLAAVQTAVVAPAPLSAGDPRRRLELTPPYRSAFERERQAGRNRWRAATLNADAYVVRRAALDAAGGFGSENGEAFRLSLRLQAKGGRIDFLDEPRCVDFRAMAAATVIEAAAHEQASVVAVVRHQSWPAGGRLTAAQRLCLWSTLLGAATPFCRAVLYFTPLAVLAFGLVPAEPEWQIAIGALAIGYHVAAAQFRRFLTSGRVRGAPYEFNAIATVWRTCAAVAGSIVNRSARPEPQRQARSTRASRSAAPHLFFVGLSVAALYWAWLGPTIVAAPGWTLIAPTLVALWNGSLALVAAERVLAQRERRQHRRRTAFLSVQYDVPGETNLGGLGLAVDLAEGGVGLVAYHPFNVGQSIFMTLEGPDGRLRLQGEVRSVRRVGSGVTPSLETPAAYRIGVKLLRATQQNRDQLLHWSALQSVREATPIAPEGGLGRFLGATSFGRRVGQSLYAPVLLGGDGDESTAWGCVTHELGATGFKVFSAQPLDANAEVRFVLATPFGAASGWARLVEQGVQIDDAASIRSQEFAFTIWDNGSQAIIRKMASPRCEAPLKSALAPAGAAQPPLRTYAIALSIWFLLAAPLLSMSFLRAHAPEILLQRLAESGSTPTAVELDDLESQSRRLLALTAPPRDQLEQLYHILEAGGRRFEATRLAQALAEHESADAVWRLRWGEGLAAAGRHADAERRFQEALTRADANLVPRVHAARGRNFGAAKQWPNAVAAYEEALATNPGSTSLRTELGPRLAAALENAGDFERAAKVLKGLLNDVATSP